MRAKTKPLPSPTTLSTAQTCLITGQGSRGEALGAEMPGPEGEDEGTENPSGRGPWGMCPQICYKPARNGGRASTPRGSPDGPHPAGGLGDAPQICYKPARNGGRASIPRGSPEGRSPSDRGPGGCPPRYVPNPLGMVGADPYRGKSRGEPPLAEGLGDVPQICSKPARNGGRASIPRGVQRGFSLWQGAWGMCPQIRSKPAGGGHIGRRASPCYN